jgi:hypothetical protein
MTTLYPSKSSISWWLDNLIFMARRSSSVKSAIAFHKPTVNVSIEKPGILDTVS